MIKSLSRSSFPFAFVITVTFEPWGHGGRYVKHVCKINTSVTDEGSVEETVDIVVVGVVISVVDSVDSQLQVALC